MKFMRKNILTIMFTAAAAIIAFAACNNNETSDTSIRKPIGENVTGKWTQVKSYEKQDGKWVEVIEPEGSGTTYLMRSDGTMRSIVTMASHDTHTRSTTWMANDTDNTMTLFKEYVYKVYRLTDDELEFGYHLSTDMTTHETLEGEFKWLFRRIDESQKNFAERLLGKWHFSKSYEKKNGEWVETSYGPPDEGWHEYFETGFFTSYSRKGDQEMKNEYIAWKANEDTGTVYYKFADNPEVSSTRVTLEDDDQTMNVFYGKNFDSATGQVVEGEFKDVLIKK